MNLRWLWFDHIPPELNVPKEARDAIRRRWMILWQDPRNRSYRRWTIWLNVPIAVLFFATMLLYVYDPWDEIVPVWVGFAIAAIAVAFVAVMGLRLNTRAWRIGLCQIGYLCCVKCGYPHTGLSKDVKECPECGAAREFGKCIHCNSPQDWPMEPDDKCTQCGRRRFWRPPP